MSAARDSGQRFEIRCEKDGVRGEVAVGYAAQKKEAEKIMSAWQKMPGVIWVKNRRSTSQRERVVTP